MDVNKAYEVLNHFLDGHIRIDEFNAQADRYQFAHLEVFQEIRARWEIQPHPETIQKFSVAERALDAAVLEKVKRCIASMTTAPQMAGVGLPNIGNTCFMNASLQGFLARRDIRAILERLLVRIPLESDAEFFARSGRVRKGETDQQFQMRYNLQGWVIYLYNQLISERPDNQAIANAIQQIAYSPVFAGKFRVGNQEDAEEFLRLLMGALGMGGNNDQTSLQVLGERHLELAAPIIQLGTEHPGDISIQNLLQQARPMAHAHLDSFTGISVQLPRTTINCWGVKNFRKIFGLLQPVVCNIYDQAEERYKAVRLVPDAIVCHHGGKYGNGGHYVTVVRKEDPQGRPYYVEKNDRFVRIISEQEANQIIESSAYVVHYSAAK